MRHRRLTEQERADFVNWIAGEADNDGDFYAQLCELWADSIDRKTYREYYCPRIYPEEEAHH